MIVPRGFIKLKVGEARGSAKPTCLEVEEKGSLASSSNDKSMIVDFSRGTYFESSLHLNLTCTSWNVSLATNVIIPKVKILF
jgi:hypothetical protein